LDAVRAVFEEASGVKLSTLDPAMSFTEIGLDSLSLTQCAQLLSKRLSVSIAFRQLAEDFPSLESLCAHLAVSFPMTASAPSEPTPAIEKDPSASARQASEQVAAPALASSLAAIQASLGSVSAMVATADALAAKPEALHVMSAELELIARQLSVLQGLLGQPQGPAKSNGNGSANRERLAAALDRAAPPMPGARLGRDREGNPAWFVPSPANPQKYVKLG
jgi:acyl carrier protein